MVCISHEVAIAHMITLTNFPVIGKWSNSLTTPKSSPVAIALPPCVTQAVLTSALSALRGQIPATSGPKTLLATDNL